MPGGSPLLLTLQSVFNAIAIISIFVIGAMLIAILQSKKKRHPIILGFLITSWLAAWVALLPFFGSVWDYCLERPIDIANVPAGPVRTICHVNAVLLAYFWVAIPGFSMAFAAEVLRLLIGFLRLTHLPTDLTVVEFHTTLEINKSTSNEPELEKGHSYHKDLSKPVQKDDDSSPKEPKHLSFVHLLKTGWRAWSLFWTEQNKQRFATIIPLLTSLPAVWVVIYQQTNLQWRYVNANQFGCRVPDQKAAKFRALVVLIHLATACAITVMALLTYVTIRIRNMASGHKDFHHGFLIKLLVLSLLTGVGAELERESTYIPSMGAASVYFTPLYLISFPLLGALIFIDESIFEKWTSWFNFIKLYLTNKTS